MNIKKLCVTAMLLAQAIGAQPTAAEPNRTFTVTVVYDKEGHLLGEYDHTGEALREYVWLRDTPMVVFTPDPANPPGDPLVYFIHTDHLNTPRVVIDRNNVVRWRWISEPFGTTAPETNPSGLGDFTFNLRFPGQYADQESGLFYNYRRNYDKETGRYRESDPIGLAGGINTYSYVEANPLSHIDPRGLDNPGIGPYGPYWTTGTQLCSRPADIAFGLIDHYWINTATITAGMGADPNIPPGQQHEGWGIPVQLNDHRMDSPTQCVEMQNVDADCVNRKLRIGMSLGRFTPPLNQCQSFAYSVINSCRTGPQQ